MICTSWPNISTYGCTPTPGTTWEKLDSTTFGKDECESLCRQHASSDGCCFVGESWGCYWKGGAFATTEFNAQNFAVNCSLVPSGVLY